MLAIEADIFMSARLVRSDEQPQAQESCQECPGSHMCFHMLLGLRLNLSLPPELAASPLLWHHERDHALPWHDQR